MSGHVVCASENTNAGTLRGGRVMSCGLILEVCVCDLLALEQGSLPAVCSQVKTHFKGQETQRIPAFGKTKDFITHSTPWFQLQSDVICRKKKKSSLEEKKERKTSERPQTTVLSTFLDILSILHCSSSRPNAYHLKEYPEVKLNNKYICTQNCCVLLLLAPPSTTKHLRLIQAELGSAGLRKVWDLVGHQEVGTDINITYNILPCD